MIVALAGIGTAVALYPVVRKQGEARAVGFVASRTLEAATIYVGIVSLMSIVTLRRAGTGSAALLTAQGLAAQYQWTFFFAQSFIPAVNGVLAALPIAAWEFSLGVYLTSWGFKVSPLILGL